MKVNSRRVMVVDGQVSMWQDGSSYRNAPNKCKQSRRAFLYDHVQQNSGVRLRSRNLRIDKE